ncbi:hydrogenase nickel incorporation protein HypA [Candidatus Bathyarchaeota archaeon]|nr:hydrogenase nickel incorporation protein HypA [Candidatus Bathyarchaeota archaeon]
MHEWALAEGIISTADKFAKENNITSITEIHIMIGELQQVEHDIVEFALEQLRTPLMKNTKFIIKAIPAKFKCRNCGHEWTFITGDFTEDVSEAIHFVPEMAHVFIKCPNCGSPDFEVSEGRGVWLQSIKGIKDD